MVKIDRIELALRLPRVGPEHLGFDLEMANSFREESAVICMIGVEHYDPAAGACISTIATITRREDEEALVRWFLVHLQEFRQLHPNAKLLSFSGQDNDLPWLRERIVRYALADADAGILQTIEHIDLKREFFRKTQNNNISLKKLEELFGIEREAQITSKKVSYLLTDIITKGNHPRIPEKVHAYLREDVHYLLLILDRWETLTLDQLFLTEIEYLNQVASLLKLSRRLLQNGNGRINHARDRERVAKFADELDQGLKDSLSAGSFAAFSLPKLPSLTSKSQDLDRLVKKYVNLKTIHVVDPKTGQYRLRRGLDKPKGVLAVVRHRGKLLMIRRAETVQRAAGFWGLPGGIIEQGEAPGAAAERELLEEVGLKGQAGILYGTSPSVTGEYELFWIEVSVEDVSTLKARPEEVAEARWVGPEELAELEPLIAGASEGCQRFLGMDWGRKRRRAGP
jgi:8-oxo-dGTP pyrophosphatase MutT (NUDIX family)